ncbi:MAG: SH3 domain-containing protein [Lachnospiraceae bacterium]|nr:SH3 domain-containing protein [Lachnospiraceae bacterium]
MRETKEWRGRLLRGMFALMVTMCIFSAGFLMMGMTGHAETQIKVTSPKGAKIRQEASTSSTQVGGVENGKVLTVLNQVQGSDGFTWYQVQVNDTNGYIRSDLVEVSEGGGGDTPPAGEGEGGTGAPAEVMAVNPVSATVSGDGSMIRDQASSEGQILAQDIPKETALTVTGQVTAADGKVWYQVSVIFGETQVDGFIRSDFVTLSGELTPLTEEPPVPEDPVDPEPEVPDESAPYEVRLQDGEWLLVVKEAGEDEYPEVGGYPINELFSSSKNNAELVEKSEKTVKNQKIIIIVLVFLLVAAAAGIAFLVFKIRDMMDSAYYNEVENETLRKRNAANGRGDQKLMHSVGTDRQPARPAGARPAGAGQSPRGAGASQGQRTGTTSQGQRPAGASQSQRGVGAGQSPRGTAAAQGQRPAGSGQGQRAAGTGQNQRPVAGSGQRSAGTGQSQRPAGTAAPRPAGTPQGRTAAGQSPRGGGAPQRPAGNGRPQQPAQRVQPKNFLEEDDEFEFEFLNYDGDEE